MTPTQGQMVTWVQRVGRGVDERIIRRPALVIAVLHPEGALSLAVFVRPRDLPEPYRMREPIPGCVCSEPVYPAERATGHDEWWEPLG